MSPCTVLWTATLALQPGPLNFAGRIAPHARNYHQPVCMAKNKPNQHDLAAMMAKAQQQREDPSAAAAAEGSSRCCCAFAIIAARSCWFGLFFAMQTGWW